MDCHALDVSAAKAPIQRHTAGSAFAPYQSVPTETVFASTTPVTRTLALLTTPSLSGTGRHETEICALRAREARSGDS